MRKVFNISADCKPNLHYMVDITDRLQKIKEFVDRGEYFTINRARQYGKTTTLRELKKYLKEEYVVVSLDFQKLGTDSFENEYSFSCVFGRYFLNIFLREQENVSDEMKAALSELEKVVGGDEGNANLFQLFLGLSRICEASKKPIVLLVDEVDSAVKSHVLVDFLAQLRGYYIDRDETPTFQSVILAGVYDVRNLKMKIRGEDEHKTNSPWNIAADFDIDMSLSEQGISKMLGEYEQDHQTGMNTAELAKLLYEYTSGYPFLVSRICKLLDEKIAGSERFPDFKAAWTKDGFLAAVRKLLTEENTLFESLDNKLIDFPDLKQMLKDLLMKGKTIEYVPGDMGIRMAAMFGFITLKDGTAAVSNRIFEIRLYNGFLAEQARYMEIAQLAADEKNQFIINGYLDMDRVIRKFAEHYTELFGNNNEKFLEDNGRNIFLLYIKPIINGTGNYYIEARTRNNRRTDVIIDFRGKQYVVELKIWRGMEYNQRGEEQLRDYLEAYRLERGYMVSFNFNKNKQTGIKEVALGNKILIEAVV